MAARLRLRPLPHRRGLQGGGGSMLQRAQPANKQPLMRSNLPVPLVPSFEHFDGTWQQSTARRHRGLLPLGSARLVLVALASSTSCTHLQHCARQSELPGQCRAPDRDVGTEVAQ